MQKVFVDTNYFLRFFLKDIYEQHDKAKFLFIQGAEKKLLLLTSIIVVFELHWVLKSHYQKEKQEIVTVLRDVLSMDFIDLPEREDLRDAVLFFDTTNLSLEDCYHLIFSKKNNASRLASFDKKLQRAFKQHEEK
ncbi:MAG TPA: PIN domain-containing protein [Patescibacteria group bacterium]|nr:PIN domain-containing protein [Patescibacteria group bacterium]